ncbi:cell division protein FtsZ [Neisseria sp. Ec49-e6-T10]|uniref:cell division protein FtsZ n=1 Tax=Neisseria sp. Ec49-e6-T10 TaxID=3140744 RepID=UPI003EBA03CB
MSLVYDVVETAASPAVIKVIGVGGGGCNAINNMIKGAIHGVEFISANTDAQSLQRNEATRRVQLGTNLTRGLGAGANCEVGRNAALEDREMLAEALRGANMIFIAAGMGGGTGTGAAPVVAEIAKEMGILTVAVVTRPFAYEGSKRQKVAQEGIDALKKQVDSLIVIPNDKLLHALGDDVTMREAFKAADEVLHSAISGISEVITSPGIINLDFADVKNVMGIMGMAMMGSAHATGLDRAKEATNQAISSPLLDDITLDGARGVLVNVTTAPGCLKMSEYNEIMSVINQYVHPDAERKIGTAEDETMDEDAIRVTIIATGLNGPMQNGAHAKEIVHEHLNLIATGTDGATSYDINNVARGGRGAKAAPNTSPDFSSQSLVDSYDVPAFLRRQAD